ncbi:ATPase family associated domain-containing protein 12 [Phytophthora infestans]|uniref:ATPase family associated domain-containing protein 12 n=1 Tax=Phytophthora infestans TaxID=4787 RepID=A0A833X2D1_PHYIN|nr:ATPase family associated domain-containing protein 12 [Phytophthora infestans]
METQARALEEEVRQLCEQEQTKQTALLKQRLYSRVGQFLMGNLDMRHWWCGYSPLMVFMMRVLEIYPSSESVCVFYKRMEQQLGFCRKCVDIYHASMPSVHVELEYEFTPESIKAFFIKLQGLDADRIQRQLTDKSMGLALRETSETVALTLYEVLTQRRLLSDFRVVRVLSRWASSRFADVKVNQGLESLRGCAGLYQLLVLPDPVVREWAQDMVKHFGKIQLTGDNGADKHFLDVMEEWMYVLENEAFNKPVLSLELRTTEDLQDFLEPTNCVKTPTKQNLWSALDHVMQQMDVHSLETMLESFDTIPDLVFNFLQCADPSGDQTITLVVSKCLAVLLRCLGHRFWNHCVHSPAIVLDVIMQHCRLESWRVFVTKQFIELLPPLLVAMRPPQVSAQASNQEKLDFYLKARSKILQFLIVEDLRPKHFNTTAIVAMSRATFTILNDCYEHRMPGSVKNKRGSGRDEGALSESISIDYSVSESAFWWPCGSESGGKGNVQLEKLWMDHLLNIVVRPTNVESLVDLAAETTALILSKHLQLARDVVYSSIVANNDEKAASIEAVTKGKPIITDLLRKLCAWSTVTTIPLQVHGALFESIGGISELLNGVEAQTNSSEQLKDIADNLRKYETQTQQYLHRICEEVLLKGLANPFGFPVVSQHISACYLSPTSAVDQQVKRLIGKYAVDKKRPTQVPSPLEALLISVYRNAEAFLRGQLSMLQSMRLYGFSHAVCLPAVKKLIFVWSRVYDIMGGDLEKVFQKASNAKAAASSSHQVTDTGIAAAHLLKLPNLINDFLIALLTALFDRKTKLTVEITEATRVQCLDFGIAFWKFWTSVLKDASVSSKRVTGIISPLVECIARGSSSENKRAAELLMTVLGCLLKGSTRLDEATLSMIDSIKGEAAAIESKQSTDFGRMTKKFRQLDQTSSFFTKRSTEAAGVKDFVDLTSRAKTKLPPKPKTSASLFSSRPMSGKSAARAPSNALVDLTGIEEVSNEAAARKQHSFYSEEEYRLPPKRSPSAKDQASKAKTPFDMAQVIKGMSYSHPGSNKVVQQRSRQQTDANVEEQPEDEEEDTDMRFAALFHRIKTTRKPIAVCSLLPFYRQLLQVCMPVLLSGEFQNERSDKELQAPGLSFKKSADYVRAFLPLMVEECNNEVQEGLRKCSYGNGGHLLRYESEKPREGMRCISFSIVQKDEGLLASSQSKFGGKGRRGFHEKLFRNGDIVLVQIAVGSQNQSGFMGKREFLGVILISETEKGRRQTSSTKKSSKNEEEESVNVLFLNDGELDNATASVRSFSTEVLAASAIADTEWKVNPLCNLVTSTREYIALRSVDMLPEHLRTAILTPETYKSTQSELITITFVLDKLRGDKSSDSCAKIVKLLKRLGKMDVMLTDLRSTSIGKAVNKLRKHDDAQVKALSSKLKEKWTDLMDKKDALERAPRFLSPELWEAIKPQYNSSQLQSIHSVLNNYSMGVSLLQGPPGTGKTKTIMGLLSGLLSLRLPATAVMPMISSKTSPNAQGGDFTNFEAARSRRVKTDQSSGPSPRAEVTTFSLSGVTSALGSILRRSSDASSSGPSRTSIQALKNVQSSRSRLENKLSSRTHQSSSNLVVKRRIISRAASERSASRTNNILLCAPSNGAVNELVLRIVTDGLMDSSGNVIKVRAPSVHPEALSEEFISIVRLGNAGEDASEVVNSVCLPHIIRREMAIHPKAMQLHSLQDTQRQLRSSIRAFHNKAEEDNGQKKDRKALAKMHQQLTECSGKIRRLRDEVTTIRAKMTETILSKASIIACTLSKAGSGDFSELKHGFDALIIDEAAQAVELSTLVPIRERVARVVLVGDPKQLPATVKSVVAAKARYDRSLFERIAESGVAPSMLRVQYRMHPFLRDFPSRRFYGGMLTDGPSVMERVQKVCPGVYARTSFQPFLLYDVENSREEDMNGSKYNRVEAAFCVSLCQNMFECCADVRNNKWSVGFVSPYKEQVRVLRQEITRSGIPASVSIEVNTVDGFQGREKDVIVFSCVRSSKRGGIGFLRDIRRLNVAITRARFCLYVVGNVNTLVRDETWAALVKSARDRRLIIRSEGDSFPAVAKRLESDKYRELAAHYKAMHDKAALKAVATAKPTKASAVTVETVKQGVQSGDEVKKKVAGVATNAEVHEDKEKKTNDADVSVNTKVAIKDELPLKPSQAQQPLSESHKRPADDSLSEASFKKPRRTETAPPTEADLRGQYEIRSFRDRSSSSTLGSRQREGHSHERATERRTDSYRRDDRRDRPDSDQRRTEHADSSRREARHGSRDHRGSYDREQRRSQYSNSSSRRDSRSRDYRSSHDRERGDSRSEGTNSRFHTDDRRDRDSRGKYPPSEGRSASRSPSASLVVPPSISEKEFCQANEPAPPSKPDRMRSSTPRTTGKRPHPESRYPPPHPDRRDRVSSSRSSYLSMTNEPRSRRNHNSNAKTPTGRSTNVLRNIIGSAKNLAKSTSRVNNKTNPRSSEFS